MRPEEVHRLALEVGLDSERAIVATAIAWAESGLDPDAVGDESLADETWGPSIGLWQIRSLRSHLGTGQERDAKHLRDPPSNARSMMTISSRGTNWNPWSVFKTGKYRQHLDDVRAAVEAVHHPLAPRGDPVLVLDPGLKTHQITTFAGKLLHVPGASLSDRTALVQWERTGVAGERWYLDLCGAGVHRIISRLSGRVLTLSGPGPAGAPIQQCAWAAVDNQRWRLEETVNGSVVIASAWNADLVLDVAAESTENGAPIIVWHRHGRPNQHFTLVPA